MSVRAFSYTSQNLIDAQPSATAKIYVRSSSAADTTQVATFWDSTTSRTASLVGQREAITSTTMDSLRWVNLDATAAGTVSVYSADTAIAAVGDIRVDTQPSAADTLFVGLSGFGTTYTFRVAPSTTNEIKIGTDTGETADNIASAINDTSTGPSVPVDGTDWGTGTVANGYVSATVAGTVVTITDLLACKRQVAWACTESSANFSIRNPVGGKDGTLLTTLDPGDTEYYNGDLELDTEDLATETLPGLKTGATDSIAIGGKRPTLHIRCENVVTAITLKYQVSNDDATWDDGQTALTSADNNNLWYPVGENIQYIRLNITANSNTAAAALSAKVIY